LPRRDGAAYPALPMPADSLPPPAAPAARGETARGRWQPWVLAAGTVLLHAALLAAVPSGRFLKYPLAARGWIEGRLAEERLLDFSPLYFRLFWLLERAGLDSAAVVVALQVALAGLAVALLHLLLAERFGRRLALVGAALLALDRQLLVHGRLLEPDLLLAVLMLAAAVCARRGAAAAGALGALALATRPTALPFVALLALLAPPGAGGAAARRRWAAWLLAPSLAVLALLAAGAWSIAGAPGAPRMNPGTVLFEGNGAVARGTSAQYPATVRALAQLDLAAADPEHAAYRTVARAELGDPGLGVAAVNRLWAARAIAFVRDHPRRWLALELTKLRFTLQEFAWHDTPQAWAFDLQLGRWPSLPFSLLAALALVGLLAERRAGRGAAPLVALLLGQLAVVLVVYSSARQRLPLLAPLYYFAVAALALLLDRATVARRRIGAGSLAALLALALALPAAEASRERQERGARLRASARLAEARAAREKGDEPRFRRAGDAALAHGARWLDELWPAALAQQPELAAARAATLVEEVLRAPRAPAAEAEALRLDAATLWLAAERPERARPLVAGRPGEEPRTAVLAARAVALGGGREEAKRELREQLAARPGEPALLAELAALVEAAEAARLHGTLVRYLGESEARRLAGEALFAHRRPAEAAAILAPLVARFPGLRAARIRFVLARGEAGDLAAAAHLLLAEPDATFDALVEPLRAARLICRWRATQPEGPEIERSTALLHRLGFDGCRAEALAPPG